MKTQPHPPLPRPRGRPPRRSAPGVLSRISTHLSALALLALAACSDGEGGDGGGGGPNLPEPARLTCGAEPVRIEPGQSAELPADPDGRLLCRIDAGGGAEYAVAFVDTRAVRRARAEPEGYGGVFAPYTVAVGTGAEVPKPTSVPQGALAADALAPGFTRLQQTAPRPPEVASAREAPWTLGERFSLWDANVPGPRPARVLRIYDGHFVVAWLEGDHAPLLPRFLAQLDSAWETAVGRHAVPLMRAAYSEALPLTSPGSGQYLLVLRAEGRGGALGWTVPDRYYGGAPRLWTDLKVRENESHLRLAELLSHELAHAFQAMYMFRTRPASYYESAAGATFWAVEGGADLVSFETVRRAAGVPLAANWDARAAGASPAARRLAQWGQPGNGILTDGYANSAGFLRMLAAHRAAGGEPEDEAVGEVLRGASDGWYGVDSYSARRTGLAERMRARPGAEWSPEEALLDWALAHGADDLTANARFQDPTFLRVHELPGTPGRWQPLTTLVGNTGGGTTGMPRGYGSPHYLLLKGSGEILLSAASDVPGVRYKILRVR